jgi:hypothetical protein
MDREDALRRFKNEETYHVLQVITESIRTHNWGRRTTVKDLDFVSMIQKALLRETQVIYHVRQEMLDMELSKLAFTDQVPENPLCPDCGQPLLTGDGIETPPIYCNPCGKGWDCPEDIEDET